MKLRDIFKKKNQSNVVRIRDVNTPAYMNEYASLTSIGYQLSPYAKIAYDHKELEAQVRSITRKTGLTADNGDFYDGEIDAMVDLENRNDILTFYNNSHAIMTWIKGIWDAEKKRIDTRVTQIDEELIKIKNDWALHAEHLYKDTAYQDQVEQVKENLTDPFYVKAPKAFWQYQYFIMLFTLGLAGVDGAFLYMLMDQIFTQKPIYSWITSIALAVILNMIPLIMGAFINESRYNLKKNARSYAIALSIVYLLLFIPLSIVRINYADETVPKSATAQLINTASITDQSAEESEHTIKQYTVVALLVCEPLATSLIALFLEIYSNDRLDKETCRLYESYSSLNKERIALFCEKDTLQNDTKREMFRERRKLEGALELNESIRKLAKTVVRNVIATELKDPDSVSFLAAECVRIANEKIRTPAEIINEHGLKEYDKQISNEYEEVFA